MDIQKWKGRFERAMAGRSIDQVWESRRAIVAPGMPNVSEKDLATAALDKLLQNRLPSPAELAALELIIRLVRPAIPSKAGMLEDVDPYAAPSFPDWKGFRDAVKPYLYSVGRISRLNDNQVDALATGFKVADGLLATNRHVLDELSRGTGGLQKGMARIYFQQEHGVPDTEAYLDILGVAKVHETLDVVLLTFDEKQGSARPSIKLSAVDPPDGCAIAALGYPVQEGRNPLFVSAVFKGRFGVKQASPGEVLSSRSPLVFHDCSTLQGNSGSPLFALKDASVVGIHIGGDFLYRNEAIGGKALKEFVA